GLARQGYRVIIASRDQAKSQQVADEIKAEQSSAEVEAMALDLGDFTDIDRFAPLLLKSMPTIDVLILNAGLFTNGLRTVQSGYEAMMGIMHFGHFRLFQKLQPAVEAAGQARIVVTSSMMHAVGNINEASFSDPARHKTDIGAYGQAKLANLLFARQLAKRLEGTGISVNAFHPGAVNTGIYDELPGPIRKFFGLFLISEEKGADTALWLATSAEAGQYSGEYFVNRKLKRGSKNSRNMSLAQWLWEYSEARM
ncbi:MAG: SDR family NAD(P)-dependent oxidoreductase, partial [Nevskiales bacterium]